MYRLCFTIPPIVVAFVIYDLSYFLSFSGAMNIADCMVFIPLFSMAAKKIVPKSTPYDFDNYYAVSMAIAVSGAFLFFLLFVLAILSLF